TEVHTKDQVPLPRYGLDAPPTQAGLSDGYNPTIKYVTPNPPEGGSKATSEGDWIKDNLSLGYDLNSTFKKEPDLASQEIGSNEGERELLLKEGESLLLVAIKWQANQASKSVLQSDIVPIGLAASRNLFCIIAFSSFQFLVYECDFIAGRARVLNTSLAVRSESERISDHLDDHVSHAPLAFNSQGEHS
nr:hypothetical protein AEK19_MT2140, mitochondrial [Tanacetum cinerariifolium]